MQKPRLVTSCDLLKMQQAQRLTLGLGNEHIRMQLPPVIPDLLCHSQGPSPIILSQIGVVQLQVTLAQLMAQPDCFLQPFAQGQLPFPPGARTVQSFQFTRQRGLWIWAQFCIRMGLENNNKIKVDPSSEVYLAMSPG